MGGETNPALVKAGCRVIVPDQRGYNLSDKPKDKRAKVFPRSWTMSLA
ncbi:MAG: hypothetical protein U0X92_09905 [Anaerolineales bacterium]